MNDLTATNGLKVSHLEGDGLRVAIPPDGYEGWQKLNLHASSVVALREFFQAEADERLGRWRWPENPDYVVKIDPLGARIAHVLHEPSLARKVLRPGVPVGLGGERERAFEAAARAYFDAHPDPKPWHEAAEGEVWALTGAGGLEQPWRRLNGRRVSFSGEIKYDAVHAIAGRRLWPEVSA